jgi:hypothetical protein
MSSYITENKVICLGKNSNIYKISKIGDMVKVGDPLVIYDESYNDEFLNKMLEKMNTSNKSDIANAAKTPIRSKHNGKIIGLKIYYTVPKTELSDSLRKVISDYEKDMKLRYKKFSDMGVNIKDLVSLNEDTGFVVPVNDKIKGVKMNDNQIMIEFYIQTIDKFSVGDKCTYSTALKGINQSLIPKGQEPYLASDPSIKIDSFMSLSGYYSRMTNSFAISMALNTVLLGAEKKIKDILES